MFPALFLKRQKNISMITLTFITIITIYGRYVGALVNILVKFTYQVVRQYNIALLMTIHHDNKYLILFSKDTKKLNYLYLRRFKRKYN